MGLVALVNVIRYDIELLGVCVCALCSNIEDHGICGVQSQFRR